MRSEAASLCLLSRPEGESVEIPARDLLCASRGVPGTEGGPGEPARLSVRRPMSVPMSEVTRSSTSLRTVDGPAVCLSSDLVLLCTVVRHTSELRRSASAFCLSALALRSSASFARFASISALRLSDMILVRGQSEDLPGDGNQVVVVQMLGQIREAGRRTIDALFGRHSVDRLHPDFHSISSAVTSGSSNRSCRSLLPHRTATEVQEKVVHDVQKTTESIATLCH